MKKLCDNGAKIDYYTELWVGEVKDMFETKILNLSVGPVVCGKILFDSSDLISNNEKRISSYQRRISELSKGR